MEPVVEETHGYRLRKEYEHLQPPVYGRPRNYYLTPYCLPTYDPQYKLAMRDISLFDENDRYFFGAQNSFLKTE